MRRFPSSDGVTVAAHDLGGQGPVLLLAHATGFCGWSLEPLAAGLRQHFRCWALDYRGHGDTDTPPHLRFRWPGLGDDALAVLDGLGLGPAAPSERGSGARAAPSERGSGATYGFGHSAGGAALLQAAARRPGAFRGLYCFEPIVWPDSAPAQVRADRLAGVAGRRRAGFPSRDEAYANYAAKLPFSGLDERALRAYVDHCLAEAADGTVWLKCPPDVEASVYLAAPANGFSALGDVACPVVVARAGRGSALGGVADRQVAALPHGRLEEWPDLSHLGPMEDPDAVADAVARAFTP